MTKLKEDFEASGGVWKEWRIGDLFEKKTIKGCPKSKENLNINDSGYYMYGQNIKRQYPYKILLDDIYLQKVSEQYPILAYTSSVGEIGMICENFYRSGDNGAFQGLFPKTKDFSINILSFVLSVLKLQFSTFGYATGMANIINLTFYLPTLNNSLALDYMEQYISLLEEEKMLQVNKFLKDSCLNDTTLTAEETAALVKFRNGDVRFEEKKIGELFTLKAIKQAKSQSLIPEDSNGVPYIVQSTKNNMYKMHVNEKWLIDNDESPVEGNAIVLGVTLPAVSYQPYKFGASQVIVARADFLQEQIGLFIVPMLEKLMIQFSYSKKPGMQIYKNMFLSFPINASNEIDYTFMQHFISALEKLVMRGVVKYKDEVLNS